MILRKINILSARSMANKFYFTTTLPYVNAEPHLGFAAELVHADIIARAALARGEEVFLNTGTDEHGLKVFRNAESAGEAAQAYVDRLASRFRELLPALGIWEGAHFVRTTDAHHVAAAQEFWRRCAAAGDIYKKQYQVKYCVGCELEKTDSELVDDHCPLHPNLELEIIDEENYFFRFSKYQTALQELYSKQSDFVVPEHRYNEIKAFVDRGLEDFSISRLAKKMPWGVPVPGDPEHVMYVWFDALVNYVSAIGWPENKAWEKWWPVTQFAGKDNLRQQAAMWQAMLLSAGLKPSRQIVIRGFVAGEGGQKMSKSLGNVINPFDLVAEYGTDAVRYFIARHLNPFEDTPVTLERIREAYNSGLANGLGNLVSRIMKMASTHKIIFSAPALPRVDYDWLGSYNIAAEMERIWSRVSLLDGKIQSERPFELIKTDPAKAKVVILSLLEALSEIADSLTAFMPATGQTIKDLIRDNRMPDQPLFVRK